MPAFGLSDTKYIMLFFTGGIFTIVGLSIHKFLIINVLIDGVAVAVSVTK